MRAHTIAMRYSDPFDWGVNLGIVWLAEASRAEAHAHCLQLYSDGDLHACVVGYQLGPDTDVDVLHARLGILCWLLESGRAGHPVAPRIEAFITSARRDINAAIYERCGIKYAVTDALPLRLSEPWPHVSFGHVLARRSRPPRPVMLSSATNVVGKTGLWRKSWG